MRRINIREEGRISGRQLFAILVLLRLEGTTLILPEISSAAPGRAAWLSVLIAILVAVPFGGLVAWLGIRFPRQTIIQYNQIVLGKPLGLLVSLLYVWQALHVAALVTKQLSLVNIFDIMPQTPLIVFIVTAVLLAAVAARQGIEAIARMAEGSFLLIIVSILLIPALSFNLFRLDNLAPVLETGVTPVLAGSLISFTLFEIIFSSMAIPFLKEPEQATRWIIYAVLTSGIIVALIAVSITAVFGVTANDIFIPFLSLSRTVRIANFIEQIEFLALAVWTLMAFIKISFLIWIGTLGIAQIFNLTDYREMVYPVGFLVVLLATLVYQNFYELVHFLSPQVAGIYGFIVQGFFIVLPAFVSKVTKRRGEIT